MADLEGKKAQQRKRKKLNQKQAGEAKATTEGQKHDRRQEFISVEGTINTQDLNLRKRQSNPWRKNPYTYSMNTLG